MTCMDGADCTFSCPGGNCIFRCDVNGGPNGGSCKTDCGNHDNCKSPK